MAGDRNPIGLSIPGVTLERELGRGSYSVVFRGRRRGVPCAIKLGRGRRGALKWFRREAAAIARLRDPGLPAVMEVGDADGVPFIVMELVEGETLGARLARGPLEVEETLELGLRLTDTLAAVHEAGLVHRDIKPDNIVLEPDGHVRLVDFGFAVPPDAVTRAAGTRLYAAPEQLGPHPVADARADLYALGRVLLEAATGTRTTSDPAEAPPPLGAVLTHLIVDDPNARYPNARALLRDLERACAGETPLGPALNRVSTAETLPLVGRRDEHAALHDVWRAVADGRGRTVLLRGPRGSGKSRLLREMGRAVGPGRGLHVRCVQDDPRPMEAFVETLERLAHSLERQSEHEPGLRARVRKSLGPELATVAGALSEGAAHLLEVDPSHRIEVGAEPFREVAAELVARLCRAHGPLLLTLDDAQWADAVSADIFARLLPRLERAPILFLVATRTEAQTGDPNRLEQALATRDPHLALEPFGETHVADFLAAYLGARPDAELTRWVVSVSDRTPFALLHLLEAMIGEGALAPRDGAWSFARERAEHVHLPGGALDLLAQRIAELEDETRRVLEAAAVAGDALDESLLSSVTSLEPIALRAHLLEARRAGLMSRDGRIDRFVHNGVREALLGGLTPETRRSLHARLAEALRARDADPLVVARHYGAAGTLTDPRPVLEVARRALARAIERYDHEGALRVYALARDAAERLGEPLDAELLGWAGEAQLRRGAHAESVALFEKALPRAPDAVTRARLLGRIAWAHQLRPDIDASWAALERAFQALGLRLPVEHPRSVLDTANAWGRARIAKLIDRPHPSMDVATREVLCELHSQNARLGVENGRPLRILQSLVQVRDVAHGLGPSETRARVEASHGVTLAALGRRAAGEAMFARARRSADEAQSPAGRAYCVQSEALVACFAGKYDRALELFAELFDRHGHWLEVQDMALNSASAHVIEALRGRPRSCEAWLMRTVRRLGHVAQGWGSLEVVAQRLRATRVTLGEPTDPASMRGVVPVAVDIGGPEAGLARTFTWAPRVQHLLDLGSVGDELERLLAAFHEEVPSPRRAHPVLIECYAAIAEVRVHQAYRAPELARGRAVKRLGDAIRELRVVTRDDLLRAHLRLAQGVHTWLRGEAKKAHGLLSEAERLADRETCPRVLFGVQRARAHMLRAEGRDGAARERARLALTVALEQGAASWARTIAEEFDVRPVRPALASTIAPSLASRAAGKRQLRTLLKVLGVCARGIDQDEQAAKVLEALRESLDADRALLALDEEGGPPELLATSRSRSSGSGSFGAADDRSRRLMAQARQSGHLEHVRNTAPVPVTASDVPPPHAVAVPLFLADRVVGVLYLEREPTHPPFGVEDEDVLVALSYQVPVALELRRIIARHRKLEEALRHAQKMEAVGRFASGLAHDFNNMLTVIQGSLDHLHELSKLDEAVADELDLVQDALERSAQLARELLSFARRSPRIAKPTDVNRVLRDLVPLLKRMVGQNVEIRLAIPSTPAWALLDRNALEQALSNLAGNAADAMPEGGTLTLETRTEHLDAQEAEAAHLPGPGEHVTITVRDTGHGMEPAIRDKVFEPFFTTKEREAGTGLGLAMVYSFVTQSRGTIALESAPGKGTTFRLHLPSTEPPAKTVPPPTKVAPKQKGRKREPEDAPRSKRILLVEDDATVRRSLKRVLGRFGYEVLDVPTPTKALEALEAPARLFDLVITDIGLPEMTGIELARRIRERQGSAKLLFLSGHGREDLEMPRAFGDVPLVSKPVGADDLRRAVRIALRGTATTSAPPA